MRLLYILAMKDLGRVGTVARFKPVHKGHAAMLEALCERADAVVIGIGSPNKYDGVNPFTARESTEMIGLVLKQFSNYAIIEVPDIGHGPKWREQAIRLFGALDHFVTANAYVESLLKGDYDVIHPITIVPGEKQFPATGTMVRHAMACFSPWEHLVPDNIAAYLNARGLVERFRAEFGLETIARLCEVPA